MRAIVESISASPVQSFTCLSHDLEAFHNDYHRHGEIELTWIEEGPGKRLIGDSLEPFSPGDLVLIGSNLPHQYQSEGVGRARAKVIQFAANWWGAGFDQLPEFRALAELILRAKRGLAFSVLETEEVTSLISELFALPEGFGRAILLLQILERLSSAPSRSLASVGFSDQVSSRSVERLRRMIELIDQRTDLGEPVPLQDVASAAALHPQSVSRFFQQQTGMSFQRYLQTIRIGKASRRLIESNDPVSIIALDVGYATQSNFNRQFLEIQGRTPTAYRREIEGA